MQYGFIKYKGTAPAIHCVRRVQEYAERTWDKVTMVLLDWEKAFDKIYHRKLFEAMRKHCDGNHSHEPWGLGPGRTFSTALESVYPHELCQTWAGCTSSLTCVVESLGYSRCVSCVLTSIV